MHFPLFLLPFDHRTGFAKELFGKSYPLKGKEKVAAQELKRVIWDACLRSFPEASESGTPGILVDEDLGEKIIKEAKTANIVHVVSTEQSGTKTFAFLHGDTWSEELLALRPTYAKALVHYNAGDEEINAPQREKLKALSDFCTREKIPLILEVLTKATPKDPSPVIASIRELLTHHIRPAIWKLEGFSTVEAWNTLAASTTIPIIMLGRGESFEEVEVWTKAASQSGKVSGFAIGRTIFLDALKRLRNNECTQDEAVREIAQKYLHFIDLWKRNAAV